jgi:primary-amine oxidase
MNETTHPLDPLSAGEIASVVAAVRGSHDPAGRLRFVSVTLREPGKDELEAFVAGGSMPGREAEVVALDAASESAFEGIAEVGGAIRRWTALEGRQPAIMPEEYEQVERIVKAHPDFAAALARRGIDDLALVRVDPIPAGAWGDNPWDGTRRICRAAAWIAPEPTGNQYARPIEGVFGIVDLHRNEVIEIADLGVHVPVPAGDGEYRHGRTGLPDREHLKPLEITQPEGPSFEIDGRHVRWQRWSFRVGFTAREGLVLHTVGYDDDGRIRPILHRASFCEMAVPYGDPSNGRHIHSPFDIGENLVGTLVNTLALGCDCLGEIRYFDASVVRSTGEATVIPNAICLHEEDAGLLWKHWDFRTGHGEVRRSRRLVISFIASIGNYDYGFYWHLHQDGTIEAEVKATGIVNTAAVLPGNTPRHGSLVAPGVNALIHQHFFCARLDFDLDGRSNTVHRLDTVLSPAGPENRFGNAFEVVSTTLRREQDAPDVIDPLNGRLWLVTNPGSRNALGEPVGYKLMPGENVRAFAQPDSALARRAGFAFKHVWVTRFDPEERYAAGEYPNQNPGPDGLPRWIEANRAIENEDLVLWYTFGIHHIPRPEDWPVMPVHHIGFKLKPVGFFDRNPALDVPPPASHRDCSHDHAGGGL